MTDLFKNKYRIASTRLTCWDYTSAGIYFITICTWNRLAWFGQVQNGQMELSEIGGIIQDEWLKTAKIRSNVELDEYAIMPDHFHGIIMIINNDSLVGNDVETTRRVVSTTIKPNSKESDITRRVVSTTIKPNSKESDITRRVISTTIKPNSLGSIIGQFKSVCTKRIRAINNYQFEWQSGYYDHIVRNESDLNRIREYIRNNPAIWTGQHKDKL